MPSSFGGVHSGPGYALRAHVRQAGYSRRPGRCPGRLGGGFWGRGRGPTQRLRGPRPPATAGDRGWPGYLPQPPLSVQGLPLAPRGASGATFRPRAGGIGPPRATRARINALGAGPPPPGGAAAGQAFRYHSRSCPPLRPTRERHTSAGPGGPPRPSAGGAAGELVRFRSGLAAFKPTPRPPPPATLKLPGGWAP